MLMERPGIITKKKAIGIYPEENKIILIDSIK